MFTAFQLKAPFAEERGEWDSTIVFQSGAVEWNYGLLVSTPASTTRREFSWYHRNYLNENIESFSSEDDVFTDGK